MNWNKTSPLIKKLLQIKYFPQTNWKYLSKDQIQLIKSYECTNNKN